MKVLDLFDGEVEEPETVELVLPAGTIVQKNGIPLELKADTTFLTHPGNVSLAQEE